MRWNVGTLDRALRVLIGIAALFFVTRTPWAWLGIIPLFTGLIGWCPLYSAMGWSTQRTQSPRT